MKIIRFLFAGMVVLIAAASQAQVSVNVNIGSPPPWGPAGYAAVQYYYLPDVEAYYDVHASMFIYFNGSLWVHRTHLPSRYRNYDLYGGYKVMMPDYHGKSPYSHYKEHKRKYAKGYHGKSQPTIGVPPGRGHASPKSPHGNSYQNHEDDHGKGKKGGHGNDKDHGHGGGNGKK